MTMMTSSAPLPLVNFKLTTNVQSRPSILLPTMLRILLLLQLVATCIAYSTASFLLHRNVAFIKGQRNHVLASSLSSTHREQKGLNSPPGESSPRQHDNIVQDSPDLSPPPFKTQLPHQLVSKLDIDPLLRHVSTYACTKRGKDSILSVLPSPNQSALDVYLNQRGDSKPSLFLVDHSEVGGVGITIEVCSQTRQ